MPQVKISDVMDELKKVVEVVSSISDRVGSLEGKVDPLDVMPSQGTDAPTGSHEHTEEVTTKVTDKYTWKSSFPVPLEYRESVNKILNNNFGILIGPLPDQPDEKLGGGVFRFSLIVPQKYLKDADKKHMVWGDIISNEMGLSGINDYLDKAWKMFDPDMRSLITADRIYAQNK